MNSLRLNFLLLPLFLLIILMLAPWRVNAFDPFCSKTDSAGTCIEGPCAGAAANSPTCQQNFQQQNNPDNPNPIAGPNGIIQSATNIMAIVAGVAAVITIIISGLMFVTAGGAVGGQRAGDSPTRAKSARAALLFSIIGLAVIAFAWSFITFITHRVVQT